MRDNCPVCHRRVNSFCIQIKCKKCECTYHGKCINFSRQDTAIQNTTWLCNCCLDDALPFHHIEENDIFIDTLAESILKSPRLMSGFNNLIFNPFEINESIDTPLTECDPDFMFYSDTQYIQNTQCDYYIEDKFISKIASNDAYKQSLGFYHHNIRSLPKHYDELQIYINSLEYIFPFIGLGETRLDDNKENLYCLEGYEPIHAYRKNRTGGGVSLFIHNDFNIEYKRRQDLEFFDNEMESIFIEVDKTCFSTKSNIIVGLIYRPPDASVEIFRERMDLILSTINKEKKIYYTMGDKNICLLKADTHNPTSDYIDTLYSHGAFPLINKPTRVTQTTATVIDHIYTNNIESQQNQHHVQGILCSSISDHFSIFHIVSNNKCPESNSQAPQALKRNYSERNINKFIKEISTLNWQEIYATREANIAYTTFARKFSHLYNTCFPLMPVKKGYLNRLPWLTTAMKGSIKTKNSLYCNRHNGDFERNDKIYKKYRTELNRVMRQAERKYYKELIEMHKSNLKKTWAIIKSVVNKNRSKSPSQKFKHNGKIIEDGQEIATRFNDFYINVGENLAKKIPKTNKHHTEYMQTINPNNATFIQTEVKEDEILKIITNFKDSAAGWDDLKPSIVKHVKKYIQYPLAYISNLSLSTGVFPDSLKLANVVPIYKSKDHMEFSNYRPVSVLPVFSKVIERLMYNRLFNYINANKLLYKYQFGFQKGRSTAMALILLVDKISEAIEKGEVVLGVFLDFSKAFDTVDHKILMEKLKLYGITGVNHDWFSNYLSGRKQYVTYNNHKSATKTITCGVPQGSILGPLLFLLYINDLSSVSDDVFSILFADDSNLFISGKDINVLCDKMNNALKDIQQWLFCNKLSLNVLKTHYMFFTSLKKQVPDQVIKICNTAIDRVYVTKFLGVHIDSKLTWKEHILHTCKKVSKSIAILAKARKKLPQNCLFKLYYAVTYPYFIYCNHVWGNAFKETLKPLFRLQKRIIRVITSSHYKAKSQPLFTKYKLLNLQDINAYTIGIFMYKNINPIPSQPSMFANFFRSNDTVHHHETRQAGDLHVPSAKKVARIHSVRIHGGHVWNSIPPAIRNSTSLDTFKKHYKTHLLEKISSIIVDHS